MPEDIAIADYDDMFFSRMLLSPLTTVIDRMSQLGVDSLVSMIESDKKNNKTLTLMPELIVRASTRR